MQGLAALAFLLWRERDGLDIEGLRIVARPHPLDLAVECLHVLERAAAIFFRAIACAFEHFRPALTDHPFFEHDFVDPLVCKVVAVEDADGQAALAKEFADGEHGLILELAGGLILQADWSDHIHEALALAVAEFVRVLVVPAHRGLDGIAQLNEGHILGNRKTPPDLRLDAIEEYFHHHPVLVFRFRHALSLWWIRGENQMGKISNPKRNSLANTPAVHELWRVKTLILLAVGWVVSGVVAFAGPMQVSGLHPLMADLAKQVGGERVKVFDLVGEGGNPHHFEPRPQDMKTLQGSSLVLAAGKGLETYLGRLRSTLSGVTIVEVGRTIPSLTVGKDAVYTCCPSHGAGSLDPHWWHGIENMRRASRVVAQALAEKDPAGKDAYFANAAAYGKRLDDLKRWAKGELSKVPRAQRKLVTAHNAFGYFAKEFGFEVIAVAGLNKEQNTTPQDLAKTIDSVKKSGVKAVFPEQNASAKSLKSIASASGIQAATPLIADGDGTGREAGFEGMIRHNVTAITQALAAP